MRAKVTVATLGLVPILALGLSVAASGPAEAGAGISIRIGSGWDMPRPGPGHTRTPGTGSVATSPWVVGKPEPKGRPRHGHGHDRHRDDWRRDRYGYRSHYLGHYGGTLYTAPGGQVPPPVVEAPPVAAAPPEPAPPPDPRGPLRLSPARGAAVTSENWEVGEALPPGVPQVTLDWRRYELPEPPSGRIYARVGRTVLVITASDRVIESVLPPG